MDSPGFALQKLLQQASPDDLHGFVDVSAVDVLKGLNPDFSTGKHLSNFVSKFIEPSEVLRDPDRRNRIIKLLPLSKVRELAERLGVKEDDNLYKDIQAAAYGKDKFHALLSFFGVAKDTRSPINKRVFIKEINARYSLFDHQNMVAIKTKRVLSVSPHKAVLHMPTGSGKTRTTMHIIASHLKQNNPTLIFWLAQSSELLDQAASEFERAWNFLGDRSVSLVRFWGHSDADILAVRDGIVVAGLGKMHAFSKHRPNAILCLADRASLTVIDEAHQAVAPTYRSVLDTLHTKRPNNALLGLTATPGRTWSDIKEDKKLSDYFGNQKVTLRAEGFKNDPIAFLISKGYLAKPLFKTLDSGTEMDLSDKDKQEFDQSVDVPDGILEQLGNDTRRNVQIIKIIEELMSRHRRVIVFSPSVANAKLLFSILVSIKHEAHIVTSQTHEAERQYTIERFRGNISHPMVIVNYGVLTTGFDVPAVSAAVIARPTKSLVLYSQMVGRAIRGPKAGGNAEAEIVTIVDLRLPGFGNIADAFKNWEDVWHESE